jgi:steroid 5-alpha reductase family enzyme
VRVLGLPVFALCVALAFAVNVAAFVPAWLFQTEKFYDLTGSLTYLSVLATAIGGRLLAEAGPDAEAALGAAHGVDARSVLLALLVAIWAIRLGLFLFGRIREDGRDPRFDAIKPDFARFLMAFVLQGLWVSLTAAAALAALTAQSPAPLGPADAPALALWLAGFGLEVEADRQKRRFRKDPANRDRFIATGLWARSRHPNYLGEILLWTGIAGLAWPALSGWSLVTLVSPVFVYLLLTRISGIPLLEARGRERWGDDPAYRAHLANTPRLGLRLGRLARPPASDRASGPAA